MTQLNPQSRPAATAVIVRDVQGASPQILMMERARSMAFAAGALVFPGGAVDEADRDLARAIGGSTDMDDLAARVAAVRETLEESGLGIGFAGQTDPELLGAMRAALHQGAAFADLLDRHGMELALDRLVPFSRWHPAAAENVTRIFDTRFYVVRAPEGQEASADATENVHLLWSSAQETIRRTSSGQGRVIFPTLRNLERLAQFASFEDIAAHAASLPIEKISPWIEEREGQRYLCIPGHLGYPVTSEPIDTALRD